VAERRAITAPASAVRKKIEPPPAPTPVAVAASYFASGSDKENIQFVSSGCAIMDAALGGGWALGRVANIVGDKSSGKTLLAMEAIANFCKKYPTGWVRYAESEAAFDEEYAAALGVPIDRIEFNADGVPMATVEEWEGDMRRCMEKGKGRPGLYILDSLDALSDEAEQKRDFGEGTYGGTKPKLIGQLFRANVADIEANDVLLIVISQLRDKLNVTFGETKTRSGGRALDFYASHIVWLAEIEKLKKTIDKVERIIGIKVRAKVKKNKVGLPFREADYPILFGYGIDDLTAGVEWLISANREECLKELGLSKAGYKVRLTNLRDKGGAEVIALRELITQVVKREWALIETTFLPKSKKY
jgi:protein RecA